MIRFKFTHLQRDLGAPISFEVAHDRLGKLKTSFGEYLDVLRKFSVARDDFEPLVSAAMLIRKPKNAKPSSRKAEDWNSLQSHLEKLCARYAEELGENAYGAFNAITEFASHPPDNCCVHRERHSFQQRAGLWLTEFSRECRRAEFKLADYIERISKANGNARPQSERYR